MKIPQEIIDSWLATFKACNYVAIFVLFAALHHFVDEWILPMIFGPVDLPENFQNPVRMLVVVISWVGFILVYARLIYHMVAAFYPRLEVSALPKPSSDQQGGVDERIS